MVKPIINDKEEDLLSGLKKILLFEGYVAGYRFYTDQDTEWEVMRQPLKLVRNAANEFDEFAIAVFAGNQMIGYVPQNISQEIAEKMDAGAEIITELVEVNPTATDKEKVLFRVWYFKETLS